MTENHTVSPCAMCSPMIRRALSLCVCVVRYKPSPLRECNCSRLGHTCIHICTKARTPPTRFHPFLPPRIRPLSRTPPLYSLVNVTTSTRISSLPILLAPFSDPLTAFMLPNFDGIARLSLFLAPTTRQSLCRCVRHTCPLCCVTY